MAPKSIEKDLSINNYSVLLKSLIHNNKFTQRPLSWVGLTEQYFFKIPRVSSSAKDDLMDPVAIEISIKEFNQTVLLSELDDAINRPVAIVDACTIFSRLLGDDLLTELKACNNSETIQSTLAEAISLCARLHKHGSNGFDGIPIFNYKNDLFCPAGEAELRNLAAHRKTIVVRGFEIRNFKRDKKGGHLKFFDPHELVIGAPEEDFSRFLLSVLMINWSRSINCLAWKRFNLAGLISSYEEACMMQMDLDVLSYMLNLNVAMRKFNARQAANTMPKVKRIAAQCYKQLYFAQIDFWRRSNGI